MFNKCSLLSSLPDISKWNTTNIYNMSGMFRDCKSLESLPDISKWNVENVIHMQNMFRGCVSLTSLPDISKWNVKAYIENMFKDCKKLKKKIPPKFKKECIIF